MGKKTSWKSLNELVLIASIELVGRLCVCVSVDGWRCVTNICQNKITVTMTTVECQIATVWLRSSCVSFKQPLARLVVTKKPNWKLSTTETIETNIIPTMPNEFWRNPSLSIHQPSERAAQFISKARTGSDHFVVSPTVSQTNWTALPLREKTICSFWQFAASRSEW